MKATTRFPLIPASVFIWIGFVAAISFMEAWLKFQVADLSLAMGLKIGKLVFYALNKVEWALALIIVVQIYRTAGKIIRWGNLYLLIALTILVVQTLVLLPILDLRANAIIENTTVSASHAHIYYVGMEVVKIISLFIYGLNYQRK